MDTIDLGKTLRLVVYQNDYDHMVWAVDEVKKFGYCKDCQWWIDTECRLTAREGEKPLHSESKAMANEGSSYDYTCLITAPDFGCVQFDRKAVDSVE